MNLITTFPFRGTGCPVWGWSPACEAAHDHGGGGRRGSLAFNLDGVSVSLPRDADVWRAQAGRFEAWPWVPTRNTLSAPRGLRSRSQEEVGGIGSFGWQGR